MLKIDVLVLVCKIFDLSCQADKLLKNAEQVVDPSMYIRKAIERVYREMDPW